MQWKHAGLHPCIQRNCNPLASKESQLKSLSLKHIWKHIEAAEEKEIKISHIWLDVYAACWKVPLHPICTTLWLSSCPTHYDLLQIELSASLHGTGTHACKQTRETFSSFIKITQHFSSDWRRASEWVRRRNFCPNYHHHHHHDHLPKSKTLFGNSSTISSRIIITKKTQKIHDILVRGSSCAVD